MTKPLTPLQVLLELMQRAMASENEKEAAALARAAPCVHARAVPRRNSPDLSTLTYAELDAHGEGPGVAAEAEDPG